MNKPWYRRRTLYVLMVVLLIFILWFQWESYTTNKKDYVTGVVKNTINNAFESALQSVDPKSYVETSLNYGPLYLIPQFDSHSRQGFQNAYNLQSTFTYDMSDNQQFPLYQIESFYIGQGYDSINVTVSIKYELFAGLTDTALVYVVKTLPERPVK